MSSDPHGPIFFCMCQVKQNEGNIRELRDVSKRLVADMVRLQEDKVRMERQMESEKEAHEKTLAEKQDKLNEVEMEVLMLQEKYTASTK